MQNTCLCLYSEKNLPSKRIVVSKFSILFIVLFPIIHFTVYGQQLTVDDFLAAPDMLTAKVSPNGKFVASIWNFEDQRSVVIFDIENAKVVSRFGDNVIRPYDVSWANDNRILVKLLVPYNTKKVRRESESKDDFDIDDYFMFGRIISADLNGEGAIALLNDEGSVKRNVNSARITHSLPDDPEHILMSAYRRERLTLFKVNVSSGESEKIVSGGRFTVAYVNDKAGNLFFKYDYKPVAKTIEIFKYNGQEEWSTVDVIYFDEDDEDKNKVEFKDLVGIKDGQLVYRKLNENSGFHELILLKDDQKEVFISLPKTDIVSVIRQGMDNEVIGYTTLTDIYRSYYFDESRQAVYEKASEYFKGENFSFSSISTDQTHAIVKSWGANNPVTYFTYDLVNDEIKKFNYAYSALPSEKLASGFKAQYLARDKMLINAYIYAPPSFDGSKALPLVVMPHGGPQSRNSLNYNDFTQFIATRGYLVIKPNFRGSTGYGKAFESAGYKEWGGKMQEDLEDAVAFLIKEGLVDASKVCIVGASYGGYAALMGAVKTPDMFQCVVSINGVTHLPEQVEFDLNKFESEELHTFIKESIGDPDADADMLKARSPALLAKNIKVPVLLIHGDKDEVVPYEQAEMMEKAMKKHNKTVEFITLEDAGHSIFYYDEDIRAVYGAVERFLAESLVTKKEQAN